MDVVGEMDITPWDALLMQVRRASSRVAWVDLQLKEMTNKCDGDMDDPRVRRWLKESRNERNLAARVAKAAVDSGIADRMVRQIELEGRIVADAIAAAIDRLGLEPEQRMLALETAHAHLMSDDALTVEGTIIQRPSTGPDRHGYDSFDLPDEDHREDREE